MYQLNIANVLEEFQCKILLCNLFLSCLDLFLLSLMQIQIILISPTTESIKYCRYKLNGFSALKTSCSLDKRAEMVVSCKKKKKKCPTVRMEWPVKENPVLLQDVLVCDDFLFQNFHSDGRSKQHLRSGHPRCPIAIHSLIHYLQMPRSYTSSVWHV